MTDPEQKTKEAEAKKRFLFRQAKHEILHGGSIVFPDELRLDKAPTEAQENRE